MYQNHFSYNVLEPLNFTSNALKPHCSRRCTRITLFLQYPRAPYFSCTPIKPNWSRRNTRITLFLQCLGAQYFTYNALEPHCSSRCTRITLFLQCPRAPGFHVQCPKTPLFKKMYMYQNHTFLTMSQSPKFHVHSHITQLVT